MNAGILDVALTLSGKLLAKVCGVLVLDVLHNWVPASVVVDLVSVTWGIDNVQAKTDAILLNDVRDRLNLGGGAGFWPWLKAALGVDEVGGEDGVDESGLSETSLSCTAHILASIYAIARITTREACGSSDVPTQMTLNWNPRFRSLRSICDVMLSKPTWLRGNTDCGA